jgi:hypothetical protein
VLALVELLWRVRLGLPLSRPTQSDKIISLRPRLSSRGLLHRTCLFSAHRDQLSSCI